MRGLETVAGIASIVTSITLVVLTVIIAAGAWWVWNASRRARALLDRAVEVSEVRLNDLNALLTVAQREVEQAFVSTASAMRGVRTGAAALGESDGSLDELASGGNANDHDDTDADANAAGEWRDRQAAARPRVRRRRRRD